MPNVDWSDVGELVLSHKDSKYIVKVQPGNIVEIPELDEYPPFYQILDRDFNPLFGTILLAKSVKFVNPQLYASRAETLIVLKS